MARLAEIPHGQVTQVLTKLDLAGLANFVDQILRREDLAEVAVKAIEAAIAAGRYFPLYVNHHEVYVLIWRGRSGHHREPHTLTDDWTEVFPGLKLKYGGFHGIYVLDET